MQNVLTKDDYKSVTIRHRLLGTALVARRAEHSKCN